MSTSGERQPLLQRPAAPVLPFVRALLVLSTSQLVLILIALFFSRIVRAGEEGTWLHVAASTFHVDVVCTIGAVMAFLGTGMIGLYISIPNGTVESRVFFPVLAAATASVCWCSMLRLSQAHSLDIWTPHRSSSGLLFDNVVDMWRTEPVGLFSIWRRALLRPFLVLLGAPGSQPLSQYKSWQVRELTVGAVFWFTVLSTWLPALNVVARTTPWSRRFLCLWVSFWFSSMATLIAVYVTWLLTCDALQWFWGFLAKPFFIVWRGPFQLQFEDHLAMFFFTWLSVRTVYLIARGWFEGLIARQTSEESLRRALAHPFFADLEKGFAFPLVAHTGAGRSPSEGTRHTQDAKNASSSDKAFSGGFDIPVLVEASLKGKEEGTEGHTTTVAGTVSGLESSDDQLSCRSGTAHVAEGRAVRRMQDRRVELADASRTRLADVLGSEELIASCLTLHVRRPKILEDTWRAMIEHPVSELVAASMSISFEREEGLDGGGVARDWFDAVGTELTKSANSTQGLLCLVPDGTLMPRQMASDVSRASAEAEERMLPFLAFGRFTALAALSGHYLPLTLSLVMFKYLLQVPISMEDVRRLDPEFFRQRVEAVLKPGGVAKVNEAVGSPLTFMAAPPPSRVPVVGQEADVEEELIEGGAEKLVTEGNKVEYVRLLCEAYLCGAVRQEIRCFLQGFWDLIPLQVLKDLKFEPGELSVLVSGLEDLDPDEWERWSIGSSDDQESPVYDWFWQAVREMTPDERALLLQFTTGSSRLPPGGFRALDPRFTVEVCGGQSPEHLPHAHTCINKLVLQHYASRAQLSQKLTCALSSAVGFGFA